MPPHLQDCQVVKLHGDYLDPGMLNTPEELSHYEAAVDRLLDRILDEYGLKDNPFGTDLDRAIRSVTRALRKLLTA